MAAVSREVPCSRCWTVCGRERKTPANCILLRLDIGDDGQAAFLWEVSGASRQNPEWVNGYQPTAREPQTPYAGILCLGSKYRLCYSPRSLNLVNICTSKFSIELSASPPPPNIFTCRNRSSVVGIGSRLQAEGFGVWIPVGSKRPILLQHFQTRSGAHPVSYSIGRVSFPKVKRSGWEEVNHSGQSSAEVKNEWC
jgi:hypothetical protein